MKDLKLENAGQTSEPDATRLEAQAEAGQPYSGPVTESYGGGCPRCGQSDGYRNIHRSHWESCDKHRTKWLVGENLFSSWHDETSDIWERNAKDLQDYECVRPIYPSPSHGAAQQWEQSAESEIEELERAILEAGDIAREKARTG